MGICRTKAMAMLSEAKAVKGKEKTPMGHLQGVAVQLRYQIATREPFVPEEVSHAQVATLWGAKGTTADHVYILGLCDEAIPGTRRDEYPGTELDYEQEQRRLFYVSITRSKRTLVLSRARHMQKFEALQMGLGGTAKGYWVDFKMSRFLRDIKTYLPEAEEGDVWLKKVAGATS